MKKLQSKFNKLTPHERLYQYDRPIVAITGGIATGKSTVTKMLEQKGFRVIDADQLVKSIYSLQETRNYIQNEFPEAWENNEINFIKLRALFFQNQKIKESIEAYIYQRLLKAFQKAAHQISDQNFYLYDVPLLFERSLHKQVDLTIVVYAPENIQLARLIDRDQMKRDAAIRILKAQMDIEEKKELADFVINNSGTLAELAAEVDQLLLQIID